MFGLSSVMLIPGHSLRPGRGDVLLGLGKGGVWRRGGSPQGNQGTVSMGTESGYRVALSSDSS